MLGGRQRQINVWLDADAAARHNLTVTDVSRALQTQNVEIPGGPHRTGAAVDLTLRTRGASHVEEFGDIVVRDATATRCDLRDVARVEDGMAEVATLANMNGEPTVLLQVRKQSGTNTVEVVDASRSASRRLDHAPARLRHARRPRPGRSSSRPRSGASRST